MALTSRGDELTRAHKDEQIALAGRAAGEAYAFWDELNRSDPMAWAYSQALMLDVWKGRSARLGAAYLTEFSLAETGDALPVVRANRSLDRSIRITVSTGVRELEKVGSPGSTLTEQGVRERFAEIVAAETQRTYREMVANSSKGRRVAWRRVTDGNPCAFCAMLAARGPVYTETTSTTSKYGLRYHKGCGCTAEPWFGDWADWVPTPQEQQYIGAYERAARQADAADEPRVAPVAIRDSAGNIIGRSEDNILWRMRRNDPGLFSDGVHAAA